MCIYCEQMGPICAWVRYGNDFPDYSSLSCRRKRCHRKRAAQIFPFSSSNLENSWLAFQLTVLSASSTHRCAWRVSASCRRACTAQRTGGWWSRRRPLPPHLRRLQRRLEAKHGASAYSPCHETTLLSCCCCCNAPWRCMFGLLAICDAFIKAIFHAVFRK